MSLVASLVNCSSAAGSGPSTSESQPSAVVGDEARANTPQPDAATAFEALAASSYQSHVELIIERGPHAIAVLSGRNTFTLAEARRAPEGWRAWVSGYAVPFEDFAEVHGLEGHPRRRAFELAAEQALLEREGSVLSITLDEAADMDGRRGMHDRSRLKALYEDRNATLTCEGGRVFAADNRVRIEVCVKDGRAASARLVLIEPPSTQDTLNVFHGTREGSASTSALVFTERHEPRGDAWSTVGKLSLDTTVNLRHAAPATSFSGARPPVEAKLAGEVTLIGLDL